MFINYKHKTYEIAVYKLTGLRVVFMLPQAMQMYGVPDLSSAVKNLRPVKPTPSEIYVCGGGLLVASINAPHL